MNEQYNISIIGISAPTIFMKFSIQRLSGGDKPICLVFIFRKFPKKLIPVKLGHPGIYFYEAIAEACKIFEA